MYCVVYCQDKENVSDLRSKTLPVHREYLATQRDKVIWAGATMTDDNEIMTGSLYIVNVNDRAAAADFISNDPLHRVGVFERVEVKRVRRGIFEPALAPEWF